MRDADDESQEELEDGEEDDGEESDGEETATTTTAPAAPRRSPRSASTSRPAGDYGYG